MSLSKDKLEQIKDKIAITCCRFEAGTLIDEKVLEDPALLPDFIDSGLVVLPENALKVGQVLGGKLKVTVDALVPLTPENVDGWNEDINSPSQSESASSSSDGGQKFSSGSIVQSFSSSGMVNIKIGKGENIDISFPTQGGVSQTQPALGGGIQKPVAESFGVQNFEEKVVRTLKKEYVKVNEVKLGTESSFKNNVLTINKNLANDAMQKSGKLVKKFTYKIFTEKDYGKVVDTIMDVQPIAVKMEGELGTGVTRVLDKVILVLTGVDENNKQIGEFGSSEGEIDRNVMWGRPGAPDKGDIFVLCHVTLEANSGMERPGPLAAHIAADFLMQEIRDVIKAAENVEVAKTEIFEHVRRPGKPKVAVLKEIMGQGAMHDNLILPTEPVGTVGGVPNVDLGNLPVALSPLEILDGGIHALTCIGPASKETSRHYFREPLIMTALQDKEIDFIGSSIVGSPQVNGEKFYVSNRVGVMFEYINPDGVIITTEGFGNNHIDFAEHHRSIGKRGIKVVGMTYSSMQGGLVVGNEYMNAMVDLNKSKEGIENEILSNNTLTEEDAIRALEMLKAQIGGETIEAANRRWDFSAKENNIKLIEQAKGIKIPLVLNEQSLEKSKKRREIYEKE